MSQEEEYAEAHQQVVNATVQRMKTSDKCSDEYSDKYDICSKNQGIRMS